MDDFDLTGEIPLRVSRFRSTWSERGCEICRQLARSNPHAMPVVAERGWYIVRRCEACGGLWLDGDRGSTAISQDEAAELIAADPAPAPPLPTVIDVVSEAPGRPDGSGRWPLPPSPQGVDPWQRRQRLWEAEALAMIADVLLGEAPGNGRRHRFTMQHRDELHAGVRLQMDAYGTSLPIFLDWDTLVSRVDLERVFTRDAESEGTPYARAIGTNTMFYRARGPGEVVTSRFR